SSLFEVFTVPLLRGDTNALKAPRSIILSEALAGKYFGETDPISKTIRFEGVVDLTVTGVFTEQPAQSHLKFNALISFASLHQMVGKSMQQTWVWNPCWTYILLRSGIKPAQIEQAFPAFVQKHYPDFLKGA